MRMKRFLIFSLLMSSNSFAESEKPSIQIAFRAAQSADPQTKISGEINLARHLEKLNLNRLAFIYLRNVFKNPVTPPHLRNQALKEIAGIQAISPLSSSEIQSLSMTVIDPSLLSEPAQGFAY